MQGAVGRASARHLSGLWRYGGLKPALHAVAAAWASFGALLSAVLGAPGAANAQENWLRAAVETCTDPRIDTPDRVQSFLDNGWTSLTWPDDVHTFTIQSQLLLFFPKGPYETSNLLSMHETMVELLRNDRPPDGGVIFQRDDREHVAWLFDSDKHERCFLLSKDFLLDDLAKITNETMIFRDPPTRSFLFRPDRIYLMAHEVSAALDGKIPPEFPYRTSFRVNIDRDPVGGSP